MILDSTKNWQLYAAVNPLFGKVFDYLNSVDLNTLEEGKHVVDGDNIFLMINNRDLKKPEDAALEVHNKYIDIQIVIAGEETFGYKDRAECTSPRSEFNTEKDILFYDDNPTTYFTLHEGQMAVFFPEDGHAPMIGNGKIKKCIVKVLA
ncbi:MAG: YhcH/YjgK/YiaL family protein [Rikenellaceae bacterium]|nr:YhcH/YjgK/YiaL family protein [Rikenellaceae bacterium]